MSEGEAVREGRVEREPLIVVNEIAKTGGVNNGQTEAYTILLNIYYIAIQWPR